MIKIIAQIIALVFGAIVLILFIFLIYFAIKAWKEV